jgi:hypothetical protein
MTKPARLRRVCRVSTIGRPVKAAGAAIGTAALLGMGSLRVTVTHSAAIATGPETAGPDDHSDDTPAGASNAVRQTDDDSSPLRRLVLILQLQCGNAQRLDGRTERRAPSPNTLLQRTVGQPAGHRYRWESQ